MAAVSENPEAPKSSKLFLIMSVVLLLAGAGLGFFGVSMGFVALPNAESTQKDETAKAEALPNVAFVPIPTLFVTMPPNAKNAHLRFTAQIEVPSEYRADVEHLMPRIQDIMNGYLRALNARDIEGPGSLFEIRLQLFRRIVAVVGLGKVNSLLVTEFILR